MTSEPKYKIKSIVWINAVVPEEVLILDIHELCGELRYEVVYCHDPRRYTALYKEDCLFPTKEELIKSLQEKARTLQEDNLK